MKISLAVMALITVDASKSLNLWKSTPHTDLIDLNTDSVHIRNIEKPGVRAQLEEFKSPNEYGQVVDKTKFANPYDPDVRDAVARQQAQEEAFSVPSVRGINGRGMHAQLEEYKSPNEYGQVVDKTKFAYPYDPDVRDAVARQQSQEEAFSVPSVRGINGRGMHSQIRTLPDTGAGAGGVAYEAGVEGLADDAAIRESSEIFSSSNGAWGTGKSEVGGDAIVFSQRMKSPNEYGQVVDKTKFAYPYDPDVRDAVARQQS